MNVPRLALRALNEYRRVSPFTYLALRYTLLSSATQKDRWAKEISPEILCRREEPAYLSCRQFKEIKDGGEIGYRDVYFPCANEALAEAALLAHCAEAGGPFAPTADVFSYHLVALTDGEGSFKQYFKLFSERQAAIAKACKTWPDYIVLYADIKSFYPSIPHRCAKEAWTKACSKSDIEPKWQSFGIRLLEEQEILLRAEKGKAVRKGLLIGPLFSHVIGNLVLSDFDRKMRSKYPKRYFRYVDDTALIIPASEKAAALKFIQRQLKPIRLKLNPKKTNDLSTKEWQWSSKSQATDYDGLARGTDDRHWMKFIDRTKCFLIANPADGAELARQLHDSGFRISIPHYLSAVQDAQYVNRFNRRIRSADFQRKIADTSIQSIVAAANALGEIYSIEFERELRGYKVSVSMKRKWHISRLRYLLGRLMIVAPDETLPGYATELKTIAELGEYAAIFKALVTRDVSDLLRFSGKVNAGAAQALATMRQPIKCAPVRWSREAIEGYLVHRLFGVDIAANPPRSVKRQCQVSFTNGNHGKHDWLKAPNGFLQELLALSGESSLERHRRVLQEPVDPDERWVLFADELRGISS